MNVLVTGATGFIGSHTVTQLLRAGHTVGVFARDPEKQKSVLAGLGVASEDVVCHRGDVLDDTWVALLPQYQAVVHCAGMMSKNTADMQKMWDLNVTGSERVLRESAAAGLDPVIFLSSFMAMFPPRGPVMNADDPVTEPDSRYARTKAQAERNARALQAEGAPIVCIYPASVNGPVDPTVGSGQEFLANYVNSGSMLVTSGGLTFTDVRDLALLVSRLLEPGKGPRRIMATADYLTHQQILSIMQEQTGMQIKPIKVPGWILRTAGRLADVKQRAFGGPAPDLTYEAASVLTRCVPQNDEEARAILGAQLIGGEQSLRDMVDWMQAEGLIGP
ncbi:SDR family NAD(P)-dependent oxidoreductase [Haliea sp. E1-2-M8]|uniref:SDR family NAD(P)-dependent oxidoreductase n=1 Tax=Haliea sp. E1-2-M8 TaxID=3064706 RepID=UPI002721828E|nr:SDR family NAD(P)-dependent oxidoreductase [Haliea sp. E1-2-M8]MDO8863022.1 SDR family NAD(P)-dependent oxidoreductase [Haliea sp. E1-2-M8]